MVNFISGTIKKKIFQEKEQQQSKAYACLLTAINFDISYSRGDAWLGIGFLQSRRKQRPSDAYPFLKIQVHALSE